MYCNLDMILIIAQPYLNMSSLIIDVWLYDREAIMYKWNDKNMFSSLRRDTVKMLHLSDTQNCTFGGTTMIYIF